MLDGVFCIWDIFENIVGVNKNFVVLDGSCGLIGGGGDIGGGDIGGGDIGGGDNGGGDDNLGGNLLSGINLVLNV